jgi:hypothetical protein
MPLPECTWVNLTVLEGIAKHLQDEGWYTKANRVQEAIDEIKWWRNHSEQSRKAKADL